MPEAVTKRREDEEHRQTRIQLNVRPVKVEKDKTAVFQSVPKKIKEIGDVQKKIEQKIDFLGSLGYNAAELGEAFRLYQRSIPQANVALYSSFLEMLEGLSDITSEARDYAGRTVYFFFELGYKTKERESYVSLMGCFNQALASVSKLDESVQQAAMPLLYEINRIPAYGESRDKFGERLNQFKSLLAASEKQFKPVQNLYLMTLSYGPYEPDYIAKADAFFGKLLSGSIKKSVSAFENRMTRELFPTMISNLLMRNQMRLEIIKWCSGQVGDFREYAPFIDTETIRNARDSEKLSKAKEMKSVLSRLGIEFYDRYDADILDNVYKTVTNRAFSKGKKLALIILNKNDPKGVFLHDSDKYRSLIENGYSLVICEADNEFGVANRFFNYGFEKKEKTAISGRTYDFLLLGGHGTPWEINFGVPSGFRQYYDERIRDIWWVDSDRANVDLSDFKKYGDEKYFASGAWAGMFSKKASVILVSCSTGGKIGEVKVENPGNFQNIMEMIGDLVNKEGDGKVVTVFAPRIPTALTRFVFQNRFVVGAEYWPSGTATYKPKD